MVKRIAFVILSILMSAGAFAPTAEARHGHAPRGHAYGYYCHHPVFRTRAVTRTRYRYVYRTRYVAPVRYRRVYRSRLYWAPTRYFYNPYTPRLVSVRRMGGHTIWCYRIGLHK